MSKKSLLLHWFMVWAINPAGDSLFTQNDNLSLLEMSNISLVVSLVKKKKESEFKIRWQHTKVADSFGLCLRDTVYGLTKTGFEFSVQKFTSFPKE